MQHGDKAAEKAKELGVELVPRTTRRRRSTNSKSNKSDAIDVDIEHGDNPAEKEEALGDDEEQQRVDNGASRSTLSDVNQDNKGSPKPETVN